LYAAGVSAAVGARIINSSSTFFGNQARPSGMLVAPGRITKETAASLKEQWESNFTGPNVGRTAVLSDGLKWEPITMSAADAQLIEQLKWSREDVASVYRVPLSMLGVGQVTYSNFEQYIRTYYSGCLQYHIEALEVRFDNGLGLASDVEIEFDLEPLLRTDRKTRFESYRTAIQAGFKTINQCRAEEDDPPIPGGDEPLVQKQYVPLSMLEEINDPANSGTSTNGGGVGGESDTGDSSTSDSPDDTGDDSGDNTDSSDDSEKGYNVDALGAVFDNALARITTLRIAA